MIVKDLSLTLLKVQLREGVGKESGKPFKFYVASVVDDEANVFNFNLASEFEQTPRFSDFLSVKNVAISASVKFAPRGYDTAGQIVDMKLKK